MAVRIVTEESLMQLLPSPADISSGSSGLCGGANSEYQLRTPIHIHLNPADGAQAA